MKMFFAALAIIVVLWILMGSSAFPVMLLVGVPSTLIFALRKRHGVTSKHGYADTVLPTVRLLSDKK
jgi:hypothetical protein